MSDLFQAYVFGPTADGATLEKAKNWLVGAGILSADVESNLLSSALGHSPGSNVASVLEADDGHWRSLDVIGASFDNERRVHISPDFQTAICPHCGRFEDVPTVIDALDHFYSTGDRALSCSNCGRSADFAEWDFADALAVGDYALTIWNWPPLAPGFGLQLEAATGIPCKKVGGHV